MEYFGQTHKRYILEQTPFNQGGEGSVYSVDGSSNSNIVAKIYHPKALTEELAAKIKYMASNPPDKSILDQIAWPIDCLYDGAGKFVGFIMPKLKIDAELGELYVYPARNIQLNNDQKVVVAINICRVIAEVHKAGYVFGDFNPCNIGVNLSSGHVAFLDTDSYHIYDKTNNKLYRCVVCAAGYVAPELIQQCKGTDFKSAPLPTFTQETDRFALAIHIFKLLFNGFSPYNGIPENIKQVSEASPGLGNKAVEKDSYCFKPGNKPQSEMTPPMESFPDEIRDLFTRAFIVGRYDAKLRPTAEEWDRALNSYKRQLKQCTANPLHFYYNKLSACPYCEADERYRRILLNSQAFRRANMASSRQLQFSTPVSVPPVSTPSTSPQPTPPRPAPQTYNNVSVVSSGTLGQSVQNAKQRAGKTGFRKKFIIALISILCAIIVLGAAGGGIYYKFTLDAIQEVQNYISYLPEGDVTDFAQYDSAISEAYEAYNELPGWQQERVANRDVLLTIVPKYNEYRVNTLRETAALVTTETVSTTSYLADTVSLYQNLWDEQKALLTSEEINEYVNFSKVQQVTEDIKEIETDVVNNYHMVSSVNAVYNSISEAYRPLVYNYDQIETFHKTMSVYDKLSFTEVEGGYSVSVAEGETIEGEFEIPSEYNGEFIVEVAERGFERQLRMTSIIVPDTVKKINNAAFYDCVRLEKMTLPFTGKSEDAYGYEAVFGYIFGYTTTRYSSGAGSNYSGEFVNDQYGNVDGAVWQYTYRYNQVVSSSRVSVYYYIPSSIKEVIITKQTEVKNAVFNGCDSVEKVVYENGIDYDIGEAAFQNCESLTNFNSEVDGQIDLSGESTAVGASAFANCKSIQSYVLGEYITSIEDYAFSGCNQLKEVHFTDWIELIGDYAFRGCNKVKEVVVPNSVSLIGVGAFNGWTSLESISLPFTGRSEEPRFQYSEALAGGGGPAYYEQVLGFIFGYTTTRYTGGAGSNYGGEFLNEQYGNVEGAVWQYTYRYNSVVASSRLSLFYYIPSSLREVTITKQTDVAIAAFNGCTMLTKITFVNGIESTGECAFQNCNAEIIQ